VSLLARTESPRLKTGNCKHEFHVFGASSGLLVAGVGFLISPDSVARRPKRESEDCRRDVFQR
jgi:hypothetical protein